MRQVSSVVLLDAVIATGASARHFVNSPFQTYQAYGTTSAGAGSATIKIQASNLTNPSADGHWVDLGTITLTLATTVSTNGFDSNAAWRWVRANVTAISGTDATVTVLMGA